MDKVDQAVKGLADAKNTAAQGAEFAPEYVDFKGIRLFYKTVSHAWVIPAVISRYEKSGAFEKGLLTIYILAQPPEAVRNMVMQQLADGTVMAAAIEFFEANRLLPEDLETLDVDKLMRHPYQKKP